MSARKAPRRPKARAHNTEGRRSTPLQVAQAVIYVHEQGGNATVAANPLLQSSGSRDTLHAVDCALDALSQGDLKEAVFSSDTSYGLHLLLQVIRNAVQGAKEQVKHEIRYAGARATVEALKGGAK